MGSHPKGAVMVAGGNRVKHPIVVVYEQVLREHGIRPHEHAYRGPATTMARHHAYAVIRDTFPHYSYKEVARVLGVDHTTLVKGVQAWAKRMRYEYSQEYAAKAPEESCTRLAVVLPHADEPNDQGLEHANGGCNDVQQDARDERTREDEHTDDEQRQRGEGRHDGRE